MKILSKFAAVLAIVPVLAIASPVFAGSPGQLAGGDNYQAKNVTQSGAYGNNVSATCNDEIKYSMQLSNTEFVALNNVTLTASLPSNGGVSTATATTDLGGTSGTTDTVSATLGSGQTQTLISGTTFLYDDSGNLIKTLPDTIVSGINIGTLNGSTTEFVNFKVKVNCPTPPAPVCTDTNATNNGGPLPCTYPQPKPPVTPPAKPVAKPAPAALPNTGAGDVFEVFAGVSTFGAAAHAVTRRFRR